MLRLVVVSLLGVSSIASADVPADITVRLEAIAARGAKAQLDAPKFAFTSNVTVAAPASAEDAQFGLPEIAVADRAKTTVGVAGDVAWISANLGEFMYCAKPGCPKQTPDTWLRATVLFEKAGAAWQPLAWAITPPIPGGAQTAALAAGVVPDAIPANVAGAEDAAKAFEAAMADPKALGAAISTRKEVVLYGSEQAERYASGATVKSQVGAWGLAFKVRDGMRAGTSKSGTVAWVAANVDGKFVKQPKMKPVPYRVFAILEKTGSEWKIVALQFSTSV